LFNEENEHVDKWQDITLRGKYPLGGLLKDGTTEKVIFVYHDESIYNVNDDSREFWQDNQTSSMKSKGKGQGIMVSDFLTENGFLDEDGSENLRVCLEYNSDGHWTHERMKNQVITAIRVFEKKYTGHKGVFIFDNALTHTAKESNALVARHIGVNDGGKQRILRDTIWNGQTQKLVNEQGKPKGLKTILIERGLYNREMKKEDMIEALSKCEDFANEKPIIQKIIEEHGHIFLLLPKFHCELNPIERCWASSKHYVRPRLNGSIVKLRELIKQSLEDINKDLIRKYFRKVRNYEEAYRQGVTGGEMANFLKEYKSHRVVGMLM